MFGGGLAAPTRSMAAAAEPALDAEGKAWYGDRILPKYTKTRMLGRGGCAVVWLGTSNSKPGTKVAMKQVAKGQSAKHRADEDSARTEANFGDLFFELPGGAPKLSPIEHPGVRHIVRLLDVAETNQDLWLVMEYGGATLTKLLFEIKGEFAGSERVYRVHHLPFYEAMKRDVRGLKHFLRQILQAILVLSDHEVVHSDLKPENILVENGEAGDVLRSHARLCDFGSAFFFDKSARPNVATPEYMPPEALESCGAVARSFLSRGTSMPTKKAESSPPEPWSFDIWSLGAIFLELCHGVPLWLSYKCRVQTGRKDHRVTGLLAVPSRDPGRIRQRQRELTATEGALRKALCDSPGIALDEDGMDLLQAMLCWDARTRISPEEALAHPFLVED